MPSRTRTPRRSSAPSLLKILLTLALLAVGGVLALLVFAQCWPIPILILILMLPKPTRDF